MSEKVFKEEKIITQHDVENQQLRKEENEKLRKENEQLRKNDVVKDATIKEPIEIKNFKEDKNIADNCLNWFDKNRFKKILAIIDSSKFSHKNKIGEFKYIDIKDLVNNIKNNAISEISDKKGLNALNEIKNADIIKYKQGTPGQKELLNLFNDLLDTTLTDETLMSSNEDNENKNENENRDDDDETMSQNKKNIIIKNKNDVLDEIIDKSKSFEEQIKSLKKREDLKGYWPYNDYDDKELKSKYFKIQLADMSNEIDEKLFEQIFGHKFETLANKLINTTNKEENQIIVKNIEKNKDKLLKKEKIRPYNFVVIHL